MKRYLALALLCAASLASAQSAKPISQPRQTYVDGSGLPCSGCSLYSYAAGTTTPLATYTDSSGAVPNTNPVILDASGSALIWLGAGSYKLVLKDTFGTTISTSDNIPGTVNYLGLAGGHLTGAMFGPQLNFGIYASQFASVVAADTAGSICGGNCVVKLDNNFSLAANTTLSSKWDMSAGGVLTLGTFTLTPTIPVIPGKSQWINASGGGKVAFPPGQERVAIDWYGVKYDSTFTTLVPLVASVVTDNTAAVNAASASAKLSGLPLVSLAAHVEGSTTGYLGVTGQLVFDNLPAGIGSMGGSTAVSILTSYTAGCAVVISNGINASFGGFSLNYAVSTAGVTTASGVCPQTWRRGILRDIRVTGAYRDFDTSVGSGTGLYQTTLMNIWANSPTGYGLYLAAPSGGTISSNTFINPRVDCSTNPTQVVIQQLFLSGASANEFKGMNLQNCQGGGIFQGSDAANTTYSNNHWEANTPTGSGNSSDGFLITRGSHTTIISGLDWIGNFVNTANVSGGHYSLFLAQTGQSVFKIDHVYSSQNQLTSVTMPLCEIAEFSGMGPAKCSFGTGSIDNLDGTLIVGAQANFAASAFSTYIDQQTPSGLLNPDGGALAIGDANAVYYCPQNDRRTYLYNTTLTANRTLTLEVPYAFPGCKLLVSIPSGLGTTNHVTVQDSLSNVLATLVSGQSATFVVAATAVTGTSAITAFSTAGAAPPGGSVIDLATFTSTVKLSVGQSVTITGLAIGTYLNGLTGTVQAANLDGTKFSLLFPNCSTNCTVGTTTDAGTATFTNGGAWQLAQFGALSAPVGFALSLPAVATVAASSVYFGVQSPTLPSNMTLNSAELTLSTIPLTCATFPVISLCSGSASATCFANTTLDGTHSLYAMTVTTPLVPAGTSLRMFITTPAAGCGTNAVTIGAVAFGQ